MPEACQIISDFNDYESFHYDFMKSELRNLSYFVVRQYSDNIKNPSDLYQLDSDEPTVDKPIEHDPTRFDWIYNEGHITRD